DGLVDPLAGDEDPVPLEVAEARLDQSCEVIADHPIELPRFDEPRVDEEFTGTAWLFRGQPTRRLILRARQNATPQETVDEALRRRPARCESQLTVDEPQLTLGALLAKG